MNPESTSSRVYTDFSGLAKLKSSARQASPDSINAVAKEFESSFVEMMITSLRDANKGESMLDSDASNMYQDMFDKQIAVDISERGDFGIAKVIERQLSKQKGQMPVVEAGVQGFGPSTQVRAPFDLSGVNKVPVLNQRIKRHVQPIIDLHKQSLPMNAFYTRQVKHTIASPSVNSTETLSANPPVITKNKFTSPDDFIATLRPHAQHAAKEIGVDPDLLIAQAALETGWGKKVIKNRDGSNSHNLFGIKAHGGWKGDSVNVSSLEFRDGIAKKEVSAFRSYSSFTESFKDYVSFIKNQPRYEKAIDNADNRNAYIHSLQKAGYATDPNYANKVINILERKNLQNVWKPSA